MPQADFKQLLNEVFVISRIIEVEVGVLLYIGRKKLKSCFYFFSEGKQHKARELDMLPLEIMRRGHT